MKGELFNMKILNILAISLTLYTFSFPQEVWETGQRDEKFINKEKISIPIALFGTILFPSSISKQANRPTISTLQLLPDFFAGVMAFSSLSGGSQNYIPGLLAIASLAVNRIIALPVNMICVSKHNRSIRDKSDISRSDIIFNYKISRINKRVIGDNS